MDIQQLQALGALVPAHLFKREIPITYRPLTPADTWADPDVTEHEAEPVTQTITAHIRKRSSADFLEMVNAPDGDKPFVGLLRCVVHPDGSPVFADLAQAKQLAEWMLIPLLTAVNEVNTFAAKKSQPRMSSGAGSPSPSAAGALPSGRRQSRSKSGPSG